jgi:hypothetical protein
MPIKKSRLINETTKFRYFSGVSASLILLENEFPKDITTSAYSFLGCRRLIEINISDSVTFIGYQAFYGCTGLTEITIPDSVTYIDDDAFCSCSSLTEIIIPDSVTSIDKVIHDYAFQRAMEETEIA